MTAKLLEGIRVIDCAAEPLAMTGRILADLGAEVVKLEPPGGDPLRNAPPLHNSRGTSLRFLAWNAGKTSLEYSNNSDIRALLGTADVIIETPEFEGALTLPDHCAPQAIRLYATPFGLMGPRARWHASDLGILAAAGNLNATGFPDRAPNRCSEPVAYAHASAEAAFAILTGLASGRPQVIDLSMQEAVLIASMGGAGQFPRSGNKGHRQGASMGKTREIWPCKDGYVSFGLRGGPARAKNYTILIAELEKENLATPAWTERDWLRFNAQDIDAQELRHIEEPLQAYFLRYTMTELYTLAVQTNLMLAPANSAAQILDSAQLRGREMFAPVGDLAVFPARFFVAREIGGDALSPHIPTAAPTLNHGPHPDWPVRSQTLYSDSSPPREDDTTGAWAGLKLVEFGSGAAGPIASRYFSEHGATVLKIESEKRPDFLRVMSSNTPHGLEGSTLFDAVNVGKQSITLNLKHPEGVAIAKRLIHWADAVVENFAPRQMTSYGLGYAQMSEEKPDLIMLSTCLNGQSGPHKDYPGFGGQGAALSGFNFLTGWPDREPIGPYGTITDSLAPRFGASALAAALLHRRQTGRGVHLDISQVETGVYSLAPWLLEYAQSGHCSARAGNHSERAVPHGVFPTAGEDRWIAIACWSDHEWRLLCAIMGINANRYPNLASRLAARDEIESIIADYTRTRSADVLARQLQYAGIEGVPLADFQDLAERDVQLQTREHFVHMERPVTGPSCYERNGFRLSRADSTYHRPAPLLGEHTDEILKDVLALDAAEISALRASGALD